MVSESLLINELCWRSDNTGAIKNCFHVKNIKLDKMMELYQKLVVSTMVYGAKTGTKVIHQQGTFRD